MPCGFGYAGLAPCVLGSTTHLDCTSQEPLEKSGRGCGGMAGAVDWRLSLPADLTAPWEEAGQAAGLQSEAGQQQGPEAGPGHFNQP